MGRYILDGERDCAKISIFKTKNFIIGIVNVMCLIWSINYYDLNVQSRPTLCKQIRCEWDMVLTILL